MLNDIPDSSDDTINGSDIADRIEELEGERGAIVDEIADMEEAGATAADLDPKRHELATWDEDNWDELTSLKEIETAVENYGGDRLESVSLIRDSYFEDYAQELAEDIGAIKPDAAWPANCIDWERAARELRMDYTSVEFDGVTYWFR